MAEGLDGVYQIFYISDWQFQGLCTLPECDKHLTKAL